MSNEANTPIPANPDKPLTDDQIDVLKSIKDNKNNVVLEISRSDGNANELLIYVKAPKLAEVIRKFVPGNYNAGDISPFFKPILMPLKGLDGKEVAGKVITRPGLSRITKNFVSGADHRWDEAPRTLFICNPDALEAGYTLPFKVDAPVPPENIRKWAKQFMEGCNDIFSNARPFKMAWVMSEVSGTK